MALSINVKDLEKEKFKETSEGTAVKVSIVEGGVDISGPVTIQGDSITSGTVDGTPSGTERTFVNNRKTQVLSAHDVVGTFTWLDFGLRTERVSQIVYTSATFPGVTVTRAFAYTQVGNNYRLDTDTWSVNVGG